MKNYFLCNDKLMAKYWLQEMIQVFVKMYQYHVQEDKVEEFLDIQEKAGAIYGRYVDFHSIYLNSKTDKTKWIEISRYKDEDDYKKSLKMINEQKEIQSLFKAFQSVLLSQKSEISEEDFLEIQVPSSLQNDPFYY
ncbi:MAG TPA: hypothetical protein VIG80_09535 [Bacillaceae bacterium]